MVSVSLPPSSSPNILHDIFLISLWLANERLLLNIILNARTSGHLCNGCISFLTCCLSLINAQSCLTLCDLMDCSPPGSSVYGILQARILEWVAISFSRGSSQPRDWTQVSCIAGRCFNLWATREAHVKHSMVLKWRHNWIVRLYCLGLYCIENGCS